ncbi:MAG TPA: hypothetical protein VNN76_11380 [Bacteroidota bacterium]|nr:hypothetical protein [Bacteroidota bacterium]
MKTFFRITYYSGIVLLFVFIALLGFTQTKTFRTALHSYLLEQSSLVLNGVVAFGQIEGNLLTGAQVDSILVTEGDIPLLSIKRIEVRYDPLALLAGKISISRLRMVEPEISLTRAAAGGWNLERLIKPSPSDSTASRWVVEVKNLAVENATIRLVDSLGIIHRASDTSFVRSANAIDYRNLHVKAVNIEASLRHEPGSWFVELRRLAAQSDQPWFSLVNLSGQFSHSPNETRVTRLVLRTAGSTVRVSARLEQANVFEISDIRTLENVPVSLELEAPRIDLHELRQFIYPWIDFLERDVSLKLKASGSFGNLAIEALQLQTPKSFLKAEGRIIHLHRPEDLELNVFFSESRINPADILARIPGLALPDLGIASEFDFSLRFRGRPDLFTVNFEATIDSGKINIDGSMNNQQSPMIYEANVRTTRLDLGTLFAEDGLKSSLTARTTIKGSGTDIRTAAGLARMDIDSSEVGGIFIRRSTLVAELGRQVLLSRLSVGTDAGGIEATSALRFFDDSTSYELQGRATSLDLAQLLKNRRYQSNLSFNFSFISNGLDLEQSRVATSVSFLPSRYGSHEFEEGRLDVQMNREGDRNILKVQSTIADLSIEGLFSPTSVIGYVENAVRIMERSITHRIASLDSLRSSAPVTQPRSERQVIVPILSPSEPIDANFDLRIHNLYPVGVFSGVELAGALSWKGKIAGTMNDLQITGATAIDWFQYRNDNVLLTAFDGTWRHDIRGIDRVNALDSISASLDVQVARMNINEMLFTDTRIRAESPKDSTRFEISTTVDSLAKFSIQGVSKFHGGTYAIALPLFSVVFPQITFETLDTSYAVAGGDGLRIDRLVLRHEVEEIEIRGSLNPFGISDVEMQIRDFLLTNLSQFSRDEEYASVVRDLAGILNATFKFQGSVQNPSMFLGLQAAGFRSRQTVFGSLNANLSYAERLLRISGELRSKPHERSVPPELVIAGSLPYDLSLNGTTDRTGAGEMDLVLRSRGLSLDVLDPFVAELANMSGTLLADVKIQGTAADPSYEGFVSLQNARFLFLPLGITYVVDGRLIPQGRKVALDNVTIRNIDQDRQDGLLKASGTFSLKGLTLKDFDFVVNGQLLVMKETFRRPDQSFYGNLFVSTNSTGLRWYGSLERSYVNGEIFVRNGSLTFPPTRGSFVLPNRGVMVTFVDDTAKSVSDLTQGGELLAASMPIRLNGGSSSGSVSTNGGLAPSTGRRSFLDNIVFDLTIETQGLTQVRFVFNPLTGEELFADLQGRLVFTKANEQTRLTGEVNVTSRSYYSFIQKFEATGKLLFTGDPVNPELNVIAKYEGLYTPADQTRDTVGVTRTSGSPVVQHPVTVVLEITGTRAEPKVKLGLEVKDEELKRKIEADVESNAIAFLINGTFRDELTQQQRSTLLGGNILMGLTSSVLSGPLTDFLRREFGVIRSVDVLFYGGGSFQETPDVRVTGEVGDAVIRFGGRVFSGLDNANVNIQFPMSSMLGSDRWRNLVLELERRDEFVETIAERRKSNSARLLYRITF